MAIPVDIDRSTGNHFGTFSPPASSELKVRMPATDIGMKLLSFLLGMGISSWGSPGP